MASSGFTGSLCIFFFPFFFFFSPLFASPQPVATFLSCLHHSSIIPTTVGGILLAPNTTSYSSLLYFSAQNLRYASPQTIKPLFIITPKSEAEISASVVCCKSHGFRIRVRGGGHDHEGLSYASIKTPFVIMDLIHFSNVEVDTVSGTIWAQAGATLGEVCYRIAAEKNIRTFAFHTGQVSTVGVGGLIAGGGVGLMSRKYGLAADHVVDARIVDANGRIHDRRSMGEDLFWAIRGGGLTSFGVITAWKIKLVPVPQTVTVFTVYKPERADALNAIDRWQHTIHTLPDELFIRVAMYPTKRSVDSNATTTTTGAVGMVAFISLFLGSAAELVPLMQEKFPEMGLKYEDCEEMSWIQSFLYLNHLSPNASLDVLLERNFTRKLYLKAKSDFVKAPIPREVLGWIWDSMTPHSTTTVMLDPHGGKMSGVPESELPFPHRYDYLCHIKYTDVWNGTKEDERAKLEWMRELYAHMAPYVSQNPRAAYINYRDLDIGMDADGSDEYERSKQWGFKYFKGNFERLALVKSRVDPQNFFRNEQSIPPLPTHP